jgi:hypothetical protein
MGLMNELKIEAVSLMSTKLGDGTGLTAGPSHQYVGLLWVPGTSCWRMYIVRVLVRVAGGGQ